MKDNNRKERVRAAALMQIQSLVKKIFLNGKMHGNQFVIGDIDGNAGDSLKIQLHGEKAGLWHDFASEQSGDIFDLLAIHFKLDTKTQFSELLDKAESLLSINTPNDAKPVVTGTWEYNTTGGNPLIPPGVLQRAPGQRVAQKTRKHLRKKSQQIQMQSHGGHTDCGAIFGKLKN